MSSRPTKKQKYSSYLTPIVRTVKNGLRYLEPYEYVFNAHVKGRWVRRTLLEVFTKEFIAFPAEYYKTAIESGKITVNGKTVATDYILDHNDLITHTTTCQENPVSGDPIDVVFESTELLVVSKPSSIPIHACGGYRQNTLVAILADERSCSEFLPAHRIDRLTSGIVILGKGVQITREISKLIGESKKEKVSKEYLALAKGCVKGKVVVRGYIACIDLRVGKYVFSETETPASKYSETEIVPIHFCKERDETLVSCFPITGRTHQIRLHLQGIGHPIVNDICYGGVYDSAHPHAIKPIPSLQHDTNGELFCGGIFLHALRYKIDEMKFDFRSPLPMWATPYAISN